MEIDTNSHVRFSSDLDFQNAIELNNISFSDDSNQYILKNINLSIRHGECIGIIGPTGGGKSTLVDIIMGLLKPTTGTVSVDNIDLYNSDKSILGSYRSLIAHVPQSIFLIDGTIEDNIVFSNCDVLTNMVSLKQAVRIAQIDNWINSTKNNYSTHVGERGIQLSGGQRQRIGIARAIYKQKPILVLDEATSALDDQTESRLMDAIQNLSSSLAVVMIAHRQSSLKYCDRIISIENGVAHEHA